MTKEKAQRILDAIEHELTEIDLALWNWQTDLDMMSFIGQDIPVRVFEPEATDVQMTFSRVHAKVDGEWAPIPAAEPVVTRVPLVKYVDGERIVIGIADVDENNGVVKAEIHDDHTELLAVPSAFSIRDEDPPLLNHDEIKAQLRNLASPFLYSNPFSLKSEATKYVHRVDLDNHPFFKKEH